MTDESKSMPDTTNPRESRPQDGGNSGNRQNSPNQSKPTHGDPDRRSIGDDNDLGLRKDVQAAGSRSNEERSNDDRSKSSEQQGKQQQSGNSGFGSEQRQGGAGASPKDAGQRRSDSQGDRQSK